MSSYAVVGICGSEELRALILAILQDNKMDGKMKYLFMERFSRLEMWRRATSTLRLKDLHAVEFILATGVHPDVDPDDVDGDMELPANHF